MANERLRRAIDEAGLELEDVARVVGIRARTVKGWIAHDRVPHAANRSRAGQLLRVREHELWPRAARVPELVSVYPERAAVPAHRWQELLQSAREHVDVLVYGGLFLPDPRADLPALVRSKAEEGVRVRLLYGDPDSPAVARRGAEEGIGDGLAARIDRALSYMRPASDVLGVEVRLHSTTLYNSIYRYDDELLVNTHAHGVGAADCPVLHLRRTSRGRLFHHYMTSFERVWEEASARTT